MPHHPQVLSMECTPVHDDGQVPNRVTLQPSWAARSEELPGLRPLCSWAPFGDLAIPNHPTLLCPRCSHVVGRIVSTETSNPRRDQLLTTQQPLESSQNAVCSWIQTQQFWCSLPAAHSHLVHPFPAQSNLWLVLAPCSPLPWILLAPGIPGSATLDPKTWRFLLLSFSFFARLNVFHVFAAQLPLRHWQPGCSLTPLNPSSHMVLALLPNRIPPFFQALTTTGILARPPYSTLAPFGDRANLWNPKESERPPSWEDKKTSPPSRVSEFKPLPYLVSKPLPLNEHPHIPK